MSEGRNSTVNIEGADTADLLSVLRFAYLGELDASPQQLPGVLQLAHKYELTTLTLLCCDAMVQSLNTDTAVAYVKTLRLLEGTRQNAN
eukprot:193784-Amphidinium_carterae.1